MWVTLVPWKDRTHRAMPHRSTFLFCCKRELMRKESTNSTARPSLGDTQLKPQAKIQALHICRAKNSTHREEKKRLYFRWEQPIQLGATGRNIHMYFCLPQPKAKSQYSHASGSFPEPKSTDLGRTVFHDGPTTPHNTQRFLSSSNNNTMDLQLQFYPNCLKNPKPPHQNLLRSKEAGNIFMSLNVLLCHIH